MEDKKKDKEHQEPDEEIKKDLDEILGQLSEKDTSQAPPPGKPETKKNPETPSPESLSSVDDTAEEGVEAILEKLSEKEEEPVEEMGVFQRIVGIFFQPVKVFEYLRQKPDILVPLILILVITAVVSNLVVDIAVNDQIRLIEQNENIPDEQKDLIIDRMEASRQGATGFLYTSILPVITTLIVVVLVTLIFWGIGNFILGGTAKFKQMFSVYLYAYLIVALLGSAIKVPLILYQKTIHVQTSLALLLPASQNKTFLYNLLANFDVFTLWFLFVFGIGFATLYRFSQTKGMVAVFSTWFVWVMVKTSIGSLLLSRFGGAG
ncbi:MAG: YIP1 family protein [Calditrichaeota bacterium]|nr:YIP1 family protein [Calditrichota bacterium]